MKQGAKKNELCYNKSELPQGNNFQARIGTRERGQELKKTAVGKMCKLDVLIKTGFIWIYYKICKLHKYACTCDDKSH